MTPLPTRRAAIIGGLSCCLTAYVRASEVSSGLASIESSYGGRLGVFAIDTGRGRTLAYRAEERFLMCSTFKLLLAALVFERAESGKENLDQAVSYKRADLVDNSPVTEANVDRGSMSVGGLCQAMLVSSDNTAAVLLMKRSGGPEGLTRFARSLGDEITRSDRFEPDLNENDGIFDTTSPRAIVYSTRRLLLGSTLGKASRLQLETYMHDCKTGLNRLRASLPSSWRIGDRPGTGFTRETNDVAIVRVPGKAPFIVSAYYDSAVNPPNVREAVLRKVGDLFAAWAML